MDVDTGCPAVDIQSPRVFRVLDGDALQIRATPCGSVGTVFTDPGLEVVWVSKQAEDVDPAWFSQPTTDILFVVQGQLRVEFADERLDDLVLAPGDLLVLPPGVGCRAYRWPRDAAQATMFLAAYSPNPQVTVPATQADALPTRRASRAWLPGWPKAVGRSAQRLWPLWG
jgi:uncharacterized protein YjlB